jgi:methylated-DNA-[protein]-cysteine S-methyltransferase
MDTMKQGLRKIYFHKTMRSPVGELKLVASDMGLAAIPWENDDPRRVRLNIVAEDKTHPILVETERQLDEYFAGKRSAFDLQLDFAGAANGTLTGFAGGLETKAHLLGLEGRKNGTTQSLAL